MQLDYSQPRNVSKASRWTGRIISTLVALFMLMDAIFKAIRFPAVMKACAEFGLTENAAQTVGIVLLISTILYMIPQTAILGAILLTGHLGGAIATHVTHKIDALPITIASIFGLLAWLGIFLREPRLQALIPIRKMGAGPAVVQAAAANI